MFFSNVVVRYTTIVRYQEGIKKLPASNSDGNLNTQYSNV